MIYKRRLICNECAKQTYNVDSGKCLYCGSEDVGIEEIEDEKK